MSTEESVDPQAVEAAQQQIGRLMDELTALAKRDVPPEVFFGQFLGGVVLALNAFGGAVWGRNASGGLDLEHELRFRDTKLAEDEANLIRHSRLVLQVFEVGEGLVANPQSGTPGPDQAGNPTEFLVLLGPAKVNEAVMLVIEIFQRPNRDRNTQRGYSRFLAQMCDLAAEYLKNQQLRRIGDRQSLWQRIEQFSRAVHASLDPRTTAYTIANEGRLLIECDRVSVAVKRGAKCPVTAISGQDTFDARSNVVMLLSQLAATVVAGGYPLWYTGDTRDLPPQIEQALQAYIDESHTKQLAVLPLARVQREEEQKEGQAPPVPLGALIVEQIEDTRPREGFEQRVNVVREHGAAALANALDHSNVFLMPLWSAIGRNRWMIEARALPKTVMALIALAAAVLVLVLVPYDFKVQSAGTLQPVFRRDVYAPLDGIVEEVYVEHGDDVKEGQVVALLRNTDLEVSLTDVLGQYAAAREQLMAVERSLFNETKKLSVEERNRMAGQRGELRQKIDSLNRQRELHELKRQKLQVTSPITGKVTTWDVTQTRKFRPVQQGQVLLNIADTSGDWELELRLPEVRMGFVNERQASNPSPLEVTYRLATDPGADHAGTVKEIAKSAEVRGEEGNTVLVRVKIDKSELGLLQPGADVQAKIHCGRRSLGFVLFHDVIAWIQKQVLFRL